MNSILGLGIVLFLAILIGGTVVFMILSVLLLIYRDFRDVSK